MKPLRSIAIFLITLTCLSCGKDQTKVDDPQPTDHIEFFGFTLVDVGWDDPTDAEMKTNYVDEVSEFTNVADLLVVNPDDDITDRLQIMKDAKLGAILNIYFLLFEEVAGSAPSGHKYQLRNDYQARWDGFVSTNQLSAKADKIAAFYIGEEPTWNGISPADLKAACDYVKAGFDQTPIMIIEAFPIIDQLVVPASSDWVGFDQYFIKDPSTDQRYLANLELLKTKMSRDQRIVIVMDSHHYQAGHVNQGGLSINQMGEIANNYQKVAASEPNVIALLGYFWPSGFDDPSSIGARGMSAEIKNEYRRIGQGIMGK